MSREITNRMTSVDPFSISATSGGVTIQPSQAGATPTQFQGDVVAWLRGQGSADGVRWLLVHADDGVIWGEWRADGLHLSSNAYATPGLTAELRAKTLLQARAFGPDAELFLWRTDDGWRGRWVRDGQGQPRDTLDEPQLLWGTTREDYQDGFVLLAEGAEGLRHAPPIAEAKLPQDKTKRFRLHLHVRHYLEDDTDGQARIAFSRLTGLSVCK
ncbi:MAG: CRISPR-associated protein Csx19 [Anaerolineae bacterium]